MFSGNWSRPSGLALAAVILAAAPVAGASAQELTHRFISPGFGGNPFNTDYLLGTANIHRPDAPEAPSDAPTEQELIARQIQARFLSNLSSDIVDAINAAQPGDTGEFELGDQRISFVRTETETRITFFNGRTGETQVVVVPDRTTTAGASGLGTLGTASSAEQALGAPGVGPAPLTGMGNSGLSLPPLPGL